ncbi:hypothetical protein [Staphylococcus phage SA3]|uniref:Uncharacterized protein n=10 Tax=Kayvirus TaxID=1857843 RepID=A0A3T0IDL7_9CAUD|nr:hypothetical protein OZ71_gp168 [Staphylococcus phage MCE-2014]YP_009781094.1 hypothetical protein QLX31_gp176 [Staphylococcus phage 676Z]YP_009781327.1 hypothetical protein QLX32_gp176 [Staphylococcus phage Fi200W]YP_009781791.1 hypothetical protein QLX34_gp175 [Staphylococcus phage P4W]ASZ78093.1 hypothetical protein [Staphylococcus phage SA3]AUG85596.1 hypothetical protein HSA30_gp092 [Staphylococcus phage HSA30]AXU40120.1 hypothetical protein VBSavMJYL01_118 [Staphylococcus phage VB_Sa
MDFNDFINSESDRVGKPKQKKKVENKLPSSTPIEEKEKMLKRIREKSLYIDLRRKRND